MGEGMKRQTIKQLPEELIVEILIDYGGYRFSLWNPSTGKLKRIPPPHCSQFECTEGYYEYGFGYANSTDDYKVVWDVCRRFGSSEEIHPTKMIYSVRNDSWKKIDNFDKRFESSLDCLGTFVNGKLHWLGRLKVKEGGCLSTIASMGLEEGGEKYQFVAIPSDCDQPKKLANLGGYLSLIDAKRIDGTSMTDMNLWVMIKYGVAESWTKIWTFSDFHDPRPIYDYDGVQPFWVTKNGDIFVAFDKSRVEVYSAKNKVREYRLDKDDLEPLPMNPTTRDDDNFYECSSRLRPPLVVYVESLVSP